MPGSEGGKVPRPSGTSSSSVLSRGSVKSGASAKTTTSGTSKTSIKSKLSQAGSQLRVTTKEAFRSMKNVVFPKKRSQSTVDATRARELQEDLARLESRLIPVPAVVDLESGLLESGGPIPWTI